jgi:hypothetical protein
MRVILRMASLSLVSTTVGSVRQLTVVRANLLVASISLV